MNGTMHPVDFPYTTQELEALFRHANEHDVEKGGIYDARSAAIDLRTSPWTALKVWTEPWPDDIPREPWPDPEPDSTTKGTFYAHWAPTPMLYQIETDEGFTLEDLLQELGRLELQAL
jgi:hypothetical protein